MDSTHSAPEQVDPNENNEGLKDLVLAILFCLLAVIVVRSFVIEPFNIPSSSMVPTLRIGDHIFVSKFSYGLSVPFTKAKFANTGKPKRGDVVVFLFPRDESLHYIKRVIGLPGDTVEFRGKDLYVNSELVKKELVADRVTIKRILGEEDMTGELFREVLGNSSHYVRHQRGQGGDFRRSSELVTVPEGFYFVAGDNRDDSYDSRSWGPVPEENLRGKAQMIWLSLSGETLSKRKMRWDRIFSSIQ